MKKLLFQTLLVSVVFFSCTKEKAITANDADLQVQMSELNTSGSRDFNGEECVETAGNCIDDVIVTPSIAAYFDDLDYAIANSSTSDFFTENYSSSLR